MKRPGSLSRVSLIVITYNEEDNIERCLASTGDVGEMIVVDSFSDDATVEKARRLGARIYQRAFVSAADQKNWAIDQAQQDWILILDADEALSPELKEEIANAIEDTATDGFWLRRRNEFFGQRIRFCGWRNDHVLRLFRRGKGHYPERAVHERLSLDGYARRLSGFLEHRPYRNMADYVDRMKSYSRRGAEELLRENKKWFPAIVTHPGARFLRMYILQLGFLDGAAGFLLCVTASVSVFFKYATLRELAKERNLVGGGEGG